MSPHDVRIRPAVEADWPALWPLWHAVVAAGDTYPYDPDTTHEAGKARWLAPPPHETWVAELPRPDAEGDQMVGTYQLRPNQPHLGDHVANAGFMVAPAARGHGIGRALGRHCLARAAEVGYRAMQFNLVVATNTASIALWRSLGFTRIGTVPKAFRHLTLGDVDAHILHRFLTDLPD